MSNPADRLYTAEHEWILLAPGTTDDSLPTGPVQVGLTTFALDALGDVVFVDLPEVGTTVTAGDACGEVESTKSVSDLYSPATGVVAEVNQAIVDDPALIAADPYGNGWLFTVTPETTAKLLTSEEYQALLD
ncbi:glycine cleavage system protein GcvH [Kineosporia rhizophila]|uniref:glycine cleavage system protein GcvH n=1 Tax=Kineosporia TaxID=49184 RepID=UPI000ACFC1D8|nr:MULTISPECIES: glycine cleavage system protein GcvH [Kineosporia]MCE0534637.1 glycine cleavage system protein GcvH [Kineosporia rhizophila]GLY15572.1 glycine cleavage system H protein [Kineosporia sp. NBRC 101677]